MQVLKEGRQRCPRCSGYGYTRGMCSGEDVRCYYCEGTGDILKPKECPTCQQHVNK